MRFLHAAWETLGVGSEAHFAVLNALGLSPLVKDEKIPVPKHKCFFGQLRELGLIDDQGCASKPLEMEVKAMIAKTKASKMVDTLGPSIDSPELKKSKKRAIEDVLNSGMNPEVKKTMTVLNLLAMEAECRTCAKNGNPRSVGSMATKCPQCHQYFG